ncbi:outer membrane protein assembly factor BamC [Marinibactrum halimedae]|uniref:Outer membrane protein assembly factor BamC n=1 Tax=Marinibactrum halimedae TaxID=1444977 RepID=A0AA37WPN4_9GAMM|nr:outer membrane protein assembly factor BamC [Marinibactrum halimedae]MCD9460168.1 outer membrane protein assembly factor BamC [Marinibactrum halimedae]GLS26362.1 hypothetical protein GCM10007877_20770 [Marinibactrum halimedae]
MLVSLLPIAGCSTLFGEEGVFRDRGDDYLKAEPIPVMVVPGSQESTGRFSQIYVVPDINDSGYDYEQSFEAPRPLPLSSALLEDQVKIQKLGQDRWIFITHSPSEVWPQVRAYLGENNYPVARTDASSGVIETTWLEFVGEEGSSHRFRITIEQGIQPESAEVHIRHVGTATDNQNKPIDWPTYSSDPEREAWMVDEVAGVLANQLNASSSSLLAQTIGGKEKVSITSDANNEPVLQLHLEYGRAWASVSHALKDRGFYLWGLDDNKGVFYTQYEEPNPESDEEPGWFSKLFGGDEQEVPTSPYTLEQLLQAQASDTNMTQFVSSSLESNTKELEGELVDIDDAPGYLVAVKESSTSEGKVVEIRIRDAYAKLMGEKETRRLLGLLRNNLI